MKNKRYLFIIIPVLVMLISFWIEDEKILTEVGQNKEVENLESPIREKIPDPSVNNDPAADKSKNSLRAPIDQAGERVARKPFGIFITKQNSPIQPERFKGFHTGTDFEILPDEENLDIPIYAVTDGRIIVKKTASGYGGVLVESAMINGSPVTIVYGHLNLASIDKKVEDDLEAGEKIGILGKGYSSETDGERKHLHLGIHKGSSVNILGYVQNKNQLLDWIDLMNIL
jgi:murein DD-endopeptidase MepM/ murein hydrolase activator NlpD